MWKKPTHLHVLTQVPIDCVIHVYHSYGQNQSQTGVLIPHKAMLWFTAQYTQVGDCTFYSTCTLYVVLLQWSVVGTIIVVD